MDTNGFEIERLNGELLDIEWNKFELGNLRVELHEARADVARFEQALDAANRELAKVKEERDAANMELAKRHLLAPMPAWVCPMCGRTHPIWSDTCSCSLRELDT